MTESEKLKLESCIDEIKNILGAINIPRSDLVDFILIHKFDIEKIVNAILEDPRFRQTEVLEKKEKGELQILVLLKKKIYYKNLKNVSENILVVSK